MPSMFTPPVILGNPPVLPETRGVAYRLFRYMGPQPVGVSVVKIGANYQTVMNPGQDLLTGKREGIEYFLGGHEYIISDDVAVALAADGYTVDIVQWNELTQSWGSYAFDIWSNIG